MFNILDSKQGNEKLNGHKTSYQTSRSLTNFALNKTASATTVGDSTTLDTEFKGDAKSINLLSKQEENENELTNKKLLTVRENAEFRNSMPPVNF